MFILLLHSIALGLILVVATFYEVKYLSEYPIKSRLELDANDDEDDEASGKSSPEKVSSKGQENVQQSGNFPRLLQPAFSLRGSNGRHAAGQYSLARAFAIAAALSLTVFASN